MPVYREDQINVLGLTNPGVYVLNRLPTPNLIGVPTNIEARVGVASWGPVNAVVRGSTTDDVVAAYGAPQYRDHDISKAVAAMTLGGQAMAWAGVRVTDGTDTAATAAIPSAGGTFTARYTGIVGNNIAVAFQATAAIGAYAAVVSFPGRTPERFDNIYAALAGLDVVAGTGYTAVPGIILSAPQADGGIQATARASLKAVGTPTVKAGSAGSGYQVGDTISLGGGVVVTVATVSSGAVSTVTLTNPGSITSGVVPATVGNQFTTSGSGTGAAFTVAFGLGPATIQPGSGYTSAPTITLTGVTGTGGSYNPRASFWAGLAQAINLGTPQRARSNYVVFSAGAGTGVPVLNTPYLLAGGTDGAAVGVQQLIGQDFRPRTGMYAFRGLRGDGSNIFSIPDTLALGDLTDTSVWATMLAFGVQESLYPIAAMPNGSTIADAVSARAAQGIDDPSFKVLVGDWPTVYISGLGNVLVSPTAVAQGLYGNLSPEQSPINKPLYGVIATLTSDTGVLTSDAEESIAQTGGVDFIGRSSALGQDFFSLMTGRNTSSNTLANGDEFTRLTNFLARSLQGAATKSIVGKLQSVRPDDPTRIKAKAVLDSFGATLVSPSAGSDGYGMIDAFATQCDNQNNPPETVRRGFLFAIFTAQYLNVVRYFVIRLAANGTVNVTVQTSAPTASSIAALAA